jgi:hypothetical protein
MRRIHEPRQSPLFAPSDSDARSLRLCRFSAEPARRLTPAACQAGGAVWRQRQMAGRPRGSPGQRWGYFTILIVRNIPSWKCSRPSSAFIAQAIT